MKKIYFTLFAFLFFFEGFAQITNTYSQRTEYYNAGSIFTAGTSGAFNQGSFQLGMYSNNGATKQVVAYRTLKDDGVNAGSARSLKLGDEFRISISANTVVGTMGFALLASPTSRSTWNDRINNSAISFNLDNYGSWYAKYYNGTLINGAAFTGSNLIGGTSSYKNFVFTCVLTAPNRMNATIFDGTTTSYFFDLLLNTSTPISEYSIFLSDDWNGLGHNNIYFNTNSSAASDYIKNTKSLSLGSSNGSFSIEQVLSDGIAANSTSTISINSLNKKGTGTINLTAQNTYTGFTTVEGGTLQLNRTGGTTIPITNNVSVSNGATLKISSNQTINDLTLNGTLLIDSEATLTIKGTILVASDATLTTTGTLIIDSGATLNITGTYTNATGNIIIKNNANVLQTSTSANTGSLIVKRNSANIQLYDYTLWSSPVTNANQFLTTFSPSTLATRFYTYNFTDNLYNVVSNPAGTTFDIAKGYLIRAPNTWTAGASAAPFSGTFTGVPNNGTIPVTLNYTDAARSYNLVGNPYPSTIDAETFLTVNSSSIENALYFWRKTNGASGSAYATYTLGGATTSTPTSAAPNGTIQVGQGFFVKAKSATTLNFTNAMRLTSASTQFFRTTSEIERNRIWLNLTNTSGVFSQMLVGYMTDATLDVDSLDGKYINDSPFALTSLINSEEYTIQGKPLPFDTNDTVPLGFKTNAAGNYTIGIDHVDGLFSNGQTIYLKDNLVNTTYNLSSGDYSFASDAGTYNSRFEIVYQSALALPTFTANNVIVYSHNGEITINSGKTPMNQVRIFDVRGRLLAEKNHINATETKLTVGAQNQVLLVKIGATKGSEVTKKIIQ
jgi:autotransporter-associated beta strand protein